jgi:ubiquinone/menaquinone biosynthesis C-methylase UbiE
MKLCKPQGTAVDVYIKRQKQGTDSAFIEEYYESMTPEFENFVSADENDFREVKYTINADQVGEEFSKFNIKIVLYSTDESIVPIAKELRIISTT